MSCGCNGGDSEYNSFCNADTPYPQVSSESVPSLISNLTLALYGEFTKSIDQATGRIIWDVPCSPELTPIPGFPALPGEGLLCYITRAIINGEFSISNILGGLAGSIPYQTGVSSTGFLNIGSANSVLVSNGSAPYWAASAPNAANAANAANATTAGTSNFVAPTTGNSAGAVLYQFNTGITRGLAIGGTGRVLTSSGTYPEWQFVSSVSPTSGNAAGSILYNTTPGGTAGLPIGANGSVLSSNGSSPQWGVLSPASLSSGAPVWQTDGSLVVSANSASSGIRITQTGSGESLRVEDSANPDATPFVVSSSGQVGVGVAPDAAIGLSLDSTGVKFSDGSVQTVALRAKGNIAATGTVVQTGSVGISSINATTVGTKIITFTAAAGVNANSTVVATITGATSGFVRVSSVGANTATIITTSTASAAADLALAIAVY